MDQEIGGRFFRDTWIRGVKQHYPGTPKAGYVAPWPEMPAWEQDSATAVYEQVRQFVLATSGATRHLSREQKGRFICLCWIGQIFKHFPQPKESYVADWEQLPGWQQQTDADIFEAIEEMVLQQV
jgi:hypothetical protein